MRSLVFLCLLPGLLAAQQKVDRRWPLDRDASIRVTVGAGEVRITAWDRDTVRVTGTIPAAASFYGGGKGQAAKLGVELPADVPTPGSRLEIQVPRQVRLWVKTVSAMVEVTGVEGEVDLISVSGNLGITGAARVVTAETMDGRIRVDGTSGVVRVRTGAGPVTVTASGGDLTATTVGGGIEVTSPRLDRGRLESVTGPVTFTGNLADGGALELQSHSGDVLLRFQGSINAEFDLTSVSGTIVNQLGSKGSAMKGKPSRFTVGSGGTQVTIRSFKGTVTVAR
jgi:hypothetical protein